MKNKDFDKWEVNYQLFSRAKVDGVFEDWFKAYNRKYSFHQIPEVISDNKGLNHKIKELCQMCFVEGYAHAIEESIKHIDMLEEKIRKEIK